LVQLKNDFARNVYIEIRGKRREHKESLEKQCDDTAALLRTAVQGFIDVAPSTSKALVERIGKATIEAFWSHEIMRVARQHEADATMKAAAEQERLRERAQAAQVVDANDKPDQRVGEVVDARITPILSDLRKQVADLQRQMKELASARTSAPSASAASFVDVEAAPPQPSRDAERGARSRRPDGDKKQAQGQHRAGEAQSVRGQSDGSSPGKGRGRRGRQRQSRGGDGNARGAQH
jgi:hypothetical protein